MSENKDTIVNDFKDIVKKIVEINTQYFKEGSNLVSQLGNSRKQNKTINPLQPELLTEALTALANLNINHYKNVVDLGFEFSKRIINSDIASTNNGNETTEKTKVKPSFVLRETAVIGNSVVLQFVLDNTKKEEATCTFKNSEFINESDPNDTSNFKTTFTPQSFKIKPGDSQTIIIEVKIGARIKPGNYQSKVEILGFEAAHFLINLSVIKKSIKTKKDG